MIAVTGHGRAQGVSNGSVRGFIAHSFIDRSSRHNGRHSATGRCFNSLGLIGLGADTLGLGLFGGLGNGRDGSRLSRLSNGLVKALLTLFGQCQFEGIGFAFNGAGKPARFDH